MSGTGYVPLPAPVTADPGFWQKGIEGLNALRDQQAKQASADAYRQSLNPDGTVNTPKYNALIASGPGAWNAGELMRQQGEAAGAQANAGTAQLGYAAAGMKLMGQSAMTVAKDPSDDNVNASFDNLKAHGYPADRVESERARWLAMSPAERQNNAFRIGLQSLDQLHQVIGQTTGVDTGGQFQPVTITQPGVRTPGGLAVGPGAANITPTPGEALQGGYHYPATQADVDAGRAKTVGQDIYIPGAEVYRRAGLPVPPGLQGSGSGGGGSVVDNSGKPVSPANPPRLLNVPNQPAPAAPSLGSYQGTGTGTAADTVPIYQPPAGTPPAPANPTSAVAAAVAAAKASGKPVPVPGGNGLVANPDGSVGTPGGGGISGAPAGSPLPANAPRAALEGGVPVASANPLQVPTVGAPGPPSPLVPGDVNAIMAGIAKARGTPSGGTRTAFNTIAAGPGTEEAQGYKTSADKLSADSLAAADFQRTQFPYVQALKNYGEGTKTGPTTDFWNQVAGTIRTPLAKIGINVGPLSDTTERVDSLGKWLASIQSNNPVSAKSDAELAQVLKGSASTHINEVAGEDMVKAGLALQRMQVAAVREWQNNPAMQAQHGTYLRFLSAYNQNTDPRAFSVDTLNPAQIARLRSQIQNGSEADAARFEASLVLAKRNGLISGAGSQAMP